MALAHREAQVTWSGTLGSGSGELRAGGGAVQAVPMSWESRSEQADGTTSPEELLAAAEAGCYAMTLALALTRHGTPAKRLDVTSACELDRSSSEHEYEITLLSVDVVATVPGLDAATFAQLAEQADRECPITNAVRGSVKVRCNAQLTV